MEPERSHDEAEPEPPSTQDFRIAELFDQGHDIAEIVHEVFNITSSNGSSYQRASKEVQAALRRVNSRLRD